jgi:hypothetical protein
MIRLSLTCNLSGHLPPQSKVEVARTILTWLLSWFNSALSIKSSPKPYLSKIEFPPQGRRGRRESIFCLAGDTAKQKGVRPFNPSLITGALAIKRLRSSSRRDGVSDPIAVSRLDQKNTPLSELCGSAVSLILKGAHANQKVQ